jgi:hypothetical protein
VQVMSAVSAMQAAGRDEPYATAGIVPALAKDARTGHPQFQNGKEKARQKGGPPAPGLDRAASASNVIPASKSRPGQLAVGCAVERRGIFLSYYNYLWVYGVTDATAQQRVIDTIAEHFRRAHTHPVQVMFYDNENWRTGQLENGRTLGSGGPSKLICIVNIG